MSPLSTCNCVIDVNIKYLYHKIFQTFSVHSENIHKFELTEYRNREHFPYISKYSKFIKVIAGKLSGTSISILHLSRLSQGHYSG